MTRGRRGLLGLHRKALSSSPPRRLIPAHLFVTQGDHRVDTHCPTGGNPGGKKRYREQNQQSRTKKEWIVSVNLKEERLQETRAKPGSQQTKCCSSNRPTDHVQEDHGQDIPG